MESAKAAFTTKTEEIKAKMEKTKLEIQEAITAKKADVVAKLQKTQEKLKTDLEATKKSADEKFVEIKATV